MSLDFHLTGSTEEHRNNVIMNSCHRNVLEVSAEDGTDISFDPTKGIWATGEDYQDNRVTHANINMRKIDNASRIEKIGIEWEDLKFTVRTSDGLWGRRRVHEKQILHNVSGYVKPGSMLAIMGASGAGKTTLLNLLAGRLTSSGNCVSEGKINVNGMKRNHAQFKKYSAYVMQDDNMFAEMTVKETITFSASLRLPATVSKEETITKVDGIIAELGLSHIVDSFIGNQILRGISGGERKRVNIGTELVTNPYLIFMDEPTTGLDSFNALNVVYTARCLCMNNRTIVATIHQPRSNIYAMFDNILLLSNGHVVYFGAAHMAVDYFSKLNFVAPQHFNPADYFIDLLSIESRTESSAQTCTRRIQFLADCYRKKELGGRESENEKKKLDALSEKKAAIDKLEKFENRVDDENVRTFQKSWVFEFYVLCKRSFILMVREKRSNIARTIQTLLFAIILGLLWLNEGEEYFENVTDVTLARNLFGIFFFLIVNISFGAALAVLFIYPFERSVVLRERASGSYRVSSYFLAKIVTEFPRSVIFVLIHTVIPYWMIGLQKSGEDFLFFFLVMLLSALVAEAMTIFVSIITMDPQTASAIVPVLIAGAMLFGGFFISSSSIPDYLMWIEYLSYIKYGFQATSLNQFPSRTYIAAYSMIDVLGLNDMSAWANLGILFGFYIFWLILCYLGLRINGPKYDHSL
eukprot:CFRG4609T1